MVISLQSSRFPDQKSRVVYACSFLRGTAFTWAQSLLETMDTAKEEPCLSDFSLFVDRLRSTFGDPDPIATSKRELARLYQGKFSASEYAAAFQRYAPRTKWNEEALKYQFIKGINNDIKDELATRDLPEDLNSYISKVILSDNQMREQRFQRVSLHHRFVSPISGPSNSLYKISSPFRHPRGDLSSPDKRSSSHAVQL